MIGSTVGIVMDLALMALLGVAIYFGVRLNRQMAVIRSGREQLEGLIKEFASATGRAETALVELKTEVGETLDQARKSAHSAGALCDDLEFLIKRGEKLADTLERDVRKSRAGSGERGAPPHSSGHEVHPSPEYGEPPRPGTGLTALPEDRAVAPAPRAAQPAPGGKDGSAAKKARAKSKSDLLKALQDMR